MRLGLFHKDVLKDEKLEVTHAFMYVHKHQDTFPLMMMIEEAHITMMTVIMSSMTLRNPLSSRHHYGQLTQR